MGNAYKNANQYSDPAGLYATTPPYETTLLASAARTTLQTGTDQDNPNGRGVVVVLDVTVASGTGGLTITIKGKDGASGKYYTLLAGAQITATGTTVYRVFPGATASANAAANDCLPKTWKVDVAVGDASSYTYSIGAIVLP